MRGNTQKKGIKSGVLLLQRRYSGKPLQTIAFSRGRLSRIIAQVRLSSEYLWLCEYLVEAVVEVGLFLYSIFGDYLWFQISEVDLCADVVGWDISQVNWQDCFIPRAIGNEGRPHDDTREWDAECSECSRVLPGQLT